MRYSGGFSAAPLLMADVRNIISAVSIAIALVAGGWAYHATRSARPDADALAPPRARGGSPGEAVASTQPRSGSGNGSVAVIASIVKSERLVSQINALGTARANEAVEITSKVSNTVTAVRFRSEERRVGKEGRSRWWPEHE